ncbi:MAG: hypothetical protein PHY43_00745 [Verrucomicrobiales bacterium]|nr:hypothetical protein [Verrucomicrobiales bacterium]
MSNTVVNGGVNAAIALRPWAGPKFYSAIFTDFNAPVTVGHGPQKQA